jgi:hypothetical protein
VEVVDLLGLTILALGPVIVPAAGYSLSGDTSARATGLQRLIDDLTALATYHAQVAPASNAANAALADSGQLPAGTYEVRCNYATGGADVASQTVGRAFLEHRDAANAANVRRIVIHENKGGATTSSPDSGEKGWKKISVLLNERVRINKESADGADGRSSYELWVRPVPA